MPEAEQAQTQPGEGASCSLDGQQVWSSALNVLETLNPEQPCERVSVSRQVLARLDEGSGGLSCYQQAMKSLLLVAFVTTRSCVVAVAGSSALTGTGGIRACSLWGMQPYVRQGKISYSSVRPWSCCH